jgi:hypothetical protein
MQQVGNNKINVPGSNNSQAGPMDLARKNQISSKDSLLQRQNDKQVYSQLVDNRTRAMPVGPLPAFSAEKGHEKSLVGKGSADSKILPPNPATGKLSGAVDTGRPGGAGGGGPGGGGLGGGAGGKFEGGFGTGASPAGSGSPAHTGMKDSDVLKKKSEADASFDKERQQNGFLMREYSWKADAKPAALTQSAATWSKTVYWHPLEVVKEGGKLELPINLPPNEGVYHFEIFGHDGHGRLGAGSIDIPAPMQPVSLKTKLSKPQAKVGDVVQLECQVQNQTSRRQPQVIAKVQLPEGTNLPPSLRQLRSAAKTAISDDSPDPTRWYVQGRELTLIWAELAAGQRVKLSIDLICSKPAEATTGTSKAYLENQETDAMVVPGLSLRISKQ